MPSTNDGRIVRAVIKARIFNDTEFSGRLGNLTINFKNNTAEISKGLELYHEGNIYLADSILIDLSLKKILNSVNVRFKTSND